MTENNINPALREKVALAIQAERLRGVIENQDFNRQQRAWKKDQAMADAAIAVIRTWDRERRNVLGARHL